MKIVVPVDVKNIIETLEANGYEAFAVGGCVRDTLLLRVPGDWDITTSAKPEEVKDEDAVLFDGTGDDRVGGKILGDLDREALLVGRGVAARGHDDAAGFGEMFPVQTLAFLKTGVAVGFVSFNPGFAL